MAVNITQLIEDINTNRYDPANMGIVALEHLADLSNTEDTILIDTSNPFVYALETATVAAGNNNLEMRAIYREKYPKLAMTFEDLEPHISDYENKDRFVTPVDTTINLSIDLDSLIDISTYVNDNSRRVVFPKQLKFDVLDNTFSIFYPIIITIQTNNRTATTTWDLSEPDQLYPLLDNQIVSTIRTVKDDDDKIDILDIEIPVRQIERTIKEKQVTPSIGVVERFAFPDNYYYAKVFHKVGGVYEELETTYSTFNYDRLARKPVAILKVIGNEIIVTIPKIYITRGLVGTYVKVEVLTTKGELTLNLKQLTADDYIIDWSDSDLNEVYDLDEIATMVPYSTKVVSGGGTALSFEELKNAVLSNSLTETIPITTSQLAYLFNNRGYEFQLYDDYLTSTTYLAIKDISEVSLGSYNINVGIGLNDVFINQNNALTNPTIKFNSKGFTLTPNTLFELTNGSTRLLNAVELAEYNALTIREKVAVFNGGTEYVNSPFYTSVTVGEGTIDYKVMDLDSPNLPGGRYVAGNDHLKPIASVGATYILKEGNNYAIYITTKSNDWFKAINPNMVKMQLVNYERYSTTMSYLNGSYFKSTDDFEMIFKFPITTDLEIVDDHISLSGFKTSPNDTLSRLFPLKGEFDVFIILSSDVPTDCQSSFDDLIGKNLIEGDNLVGVNHSKLNYELGEEVEGLFKSSRSHVGNEVYIKHNQSIEDTYPEDVWETDGYGNLVLEENPDYDEFNPLSPPYIANKLHSKGDVILDPQGNVVYKVRSGDYVRDEAGKLVVDEEASLEFRMKLFTVKTKYSLISNTTTSNQIRALRSRLLNDLETDIKFFQESMLYTAETYYYPKTTITDSVEITYGNGSKALIDCEQSVNVMLYVDQDVLNDIERVNELKTTIYSVVSIELGKSVVSVDGMTLAIKDAVGDDVYNVHVDPLINGLTDSYSLVNNNEKTIMKNKLYIGNDDEVDLIPDVNVLVLER